MFRLTRILLIAITFTLSGCVENGSGNTVPPGPSGVAIADYSNIRMEYEEGLDITELMSFQDKVMSEIDELRLDVERHFREDIKVVCRSSMDHNQNFLIMGWYEDIQEGDRIFPGQTDPLMTVYIDPSDGKIIDYVRPPN